MSLDEIREKHFGSVESANEAFNELCAMVEAFEVSNISLLQLIFDLNQKNYIAFDFYFNIFRYLLFRLNEKRDEKLFKQRYRHFER